MSDTFIEIESVSIPNCEVSPRRGIDVESNRSRPVSRLIGINIERLSIRLQAFQDTKGARCFYNTFRHKKTQKFL